MGNGIDHERAESYEDNVLQQLQQVEDITEPIPFDPLDTQRIMSRRAQASNHAPAKAQGKTPAGKVQASRSRRDLASPDDISNTMSLLACTDATHTASCRSAGVSRDRRTKDPVASSAVGQLPVIDDSSAMSPYYGVPPPEPVRPDNSHTGALGDTQDSPASSQRNPEFPPEPEPVPTSLAPAVHAVSATAAEAPRPPSPHPETHHVPLPETTADADKAPPPPAPQRPPSWRPEPPVPAPARLHTPSQVQRARAYADAPSPTPADFLAAAQPVDAILLDRFLAAAADAQGLPDEARTRTASSSGSAEGTPITLPAHRSSSPGKPTPRTPSGMVATYLTPRRGGARGDQLASPPQQHPQRAISALYRFATLAAERRANAMAPTMQPLQPQQPPTRPSALRLPSLSGDLKPLMREDSQLSPVPQHSVATPTPRDEISPRRRTRSGNRRPWGCGPRASLACICGMPDVDEGSAFDLVPLVPTAAELSTRREHRETIRPQRAMHIDAQMPKAPPPQQPPHDMCSEAARAAHVHRSPLAAPALGPLTPRQEGHRNRRVAPRATSQSGPNAISAMTEQPRHGHRSPCSSGLPHSEHPHWRDSKRQELSSALRQGRTFHHAEEVVQPPCHRCSALVCRCSKRGGQQSSVAGLSTPRGSFISPRGTQLGYKSQPLHPLGEDSYRGVSTPRQADLQLGYAEGAHSSHGRDRRVTTPPRMLGALGEYCGSRTAPVLPGPFGGPTESQPPRFRTMQQAMAETVPPTAAVAALRVQGGLRPSPQPLEATSSWAMTVALAAQSMATGAGGIAGSESGASSTAAGPVCAGDDMAEAASPKREAPEEPPAPTAAPKELHAPEAQAEGPVAEAAASDRQADPALELEWGLTEESEVAALTLSEQPVVG